MSKEAKRRKKDDLWEEWWGTNGCLYDAIDCEIKQNDTRDLIDRAEKLYLPTPGIDEKDKWVPKEGLGYGHWQILTPEAMTELRRAIRAENRERLEIIE